MRMMSIIFMTISLLFSQPVLGIKSKALLQVDAGGQKVNDSGVDPQLNLSKARLKLKKKKNKYWKFTLDVGIEEKPEVKKAYVRYNHNDRLNIDFGRLKPMIGQNASRSSHTLISQDRAPGFQSQERNILGLSMLSQVGEQSFVSVATGKVADENQPQAWIGSTRLTYFFLEKKDETLIHLGGSFGVIGSQDQRKFEIIDRNYSQIYDLKSLKIDAKRQSLVNGELMVRLFRWLVEYEWGLRRYSELDVSTSAQSKAELSTSQISLSYVLIGGAREYHSKKGVMKKFSTKKEQLSLELYLGYDRSRFNLNEADGWLERAW